MSLHHRVGRARAHHLEHPLHRAPQLPARVQQRVLLRAERAASAAASSPARPPPRAAPPWRPWAPAPSGTPLRCGPMSSTTSAPRASGLSCHPGERDHRRAQPPERGQQPQQLLGGAAVRQRQNHVPAAHAPQVPVHRLGRVQEHRADARWRPAWPTASGRSAPPCPCPSPPPAPGTRAAARAPAGTTRPAARPTNRPGLGLEHAPGIGERGLGVLGAGTRGRRRRPAREGHAGGASWRWSGGHGPCVAALLPLGHLGRYP